jgi:hypothetical protein
MFTISFDFDETTKKVTNLKVVSIDKTLPTSDNYLEVQDNKLKLGKEAVTLLEANSGDRIQVNYWTVNNQETFPVIGKSAVFTDPEGGNALSKSNTISFRGNQRIVLLEYGSLFKLEPFKTGMFKLVPIINDDNIEEEQKELDNLNMIGDEIADEFDDLPFI